MQTMKIATIIVAVVGILTSIGLGIWASKLNVRVQSAQADLQSAQAELVQAQQTLVDAEAKLVAAEGKLTAAQGQIGGLDSELEAARKRAEALSREKAATDNARKKLEEDMKIALRNRDVAISQLKGKLTVNILSRIMFDSGEAKIKDEGKQVLTQIAEAIKQLPGRQVLVVGHTDNEPTKSTKYLYDSNWELSVARSTAAVRFFTETCGVDPKQVGAVGYGEHRPVADNDTPEGRAENRRIAVVILAEGIIPQQ